MKEQMLIGLGRLGEKAPAWVDRPGRKEPLDRDSLVLSNGTLLAAHTVQPLTAADYQIKILTAGAGGYQEPGSTLMPQRINRNVQFWNGENLVSYTGPLWELSPMEVVARPMPAARQEEPLDGPEQQIFEELGINVSTFRDDVASRGLALMVSRNVTTRDDGDIQQPYNLRVAGTATQTISPRGGQLYEVSHLQIFQAELLRELFEKPGRRVLSRPLRDPNGENPSAASGPPGMSSLRGPISSAKPRRSARLLESAGGMAPALWPAWCPHYDDGQGV